MSVINIDSKTPWLVNDHLVETLTTKIVGFVAFGAMMTDASKTAKTEAEVQRNLFRTRIKRQVVAATKDGTIVPLDDAAISQMPIRLAVKLKAALDSASSPTPDGGKSKFEVIADGDGITSSIIVRLGTPVKGAAGKEIVELEFMATTLGALEDAVLSDSAMERTVALLAIAKPLGEDMTLQVLPSWAIDQITLLDGVNIMQKVAPNFFE